MTLALGLVVIDIFEVNGYMPPGYLNSTWRSGRLVPKIMQVHFNLH